MKIQNLLLLFILSIILTACSYTRIGDLTSISNRNIDDTEDYVLLEREVETVASANLDALEVAIDKLTKEHEGEFLRNAKIFIKNNGKKVKLVGDIWGVKNSTTDVNINTKAKANINLQIGDSVVFRKKGKLIDGVIIGFADQTAIIEYGTNGRKIELPYDEITKTRK